jgi:hypothetical protein
VTLFHWWTPRGPSGPFPFSVSRVNCRNFPVGFFCVFAARTLLNSEKIPNRCIHNSEKIPNCDFAGKSMAYPNSAKIPNRDFALFFAWRQKQHCNHLLSGEIASPGGPEILRNPYRLRVNPNRKCESVSFSAARDAGSVRLAHRITQRASHYLPLSLAG